MSLSRKLLGGFGIMLALTLLLSVGGVFVLHDLNATDLAGAQCVCSKVERNRFRTWTLSATT